MTKHSTVTNGYLQEHISDRVKQDHALEHQIQRHCLVEAKNENEKFYVLGKAQHIAYLV